MIMRMTKLTNLLKRLESATGPDDDLDKALFKFFFDSYEDDIPHGVGRIIPPDLTSSIDAALALVERELEGWQWYLESSIGSSDMYFQTHDHGEIFSSQHKTAPLAILTALVKAKIAKMEAVG